MRTWLGRHVGFTSTGKPIVRELPFPNCVQTWNANVYGARHINFDSAGKPIVATAASCCDYVTDCPRVEVSGTSTVLANGIDRYILLRIANSINCPSANDKQVVLEYCDPNGPTDNGECEDIPDCTAGITISGCTTCDDATKGKWTGSVVLPGGTLNFEACYFVSTGPDPDELWFRLRWWGCGTSPNWDAGCVESKVTCLDPIRWGHGPVTLNFCCDCQGTTGEDAQVFFGMETNCRKTVLARHVGFDIDGTPVVAQVNCGNETEPECCPPQCPLVATITNVSNCACLVDETTLPYETGSGQWVGFIGDTCTAELTVECTPLGDGTMRIDLSYVCVSGVKVETATGSTIVPCYDGTFDVTIPLTVPSQAELGCDDHDCTWTWTSPGFWSLTTDDCPVGCNDCPITPSNPPGSPTFGQQHSEPCTGDDPDCCRGQISVRLMI